MQFKTNLATRTYINRKKLNIALAAALVVLVFLMLVQAGILAYNAGEISKLDATQAAAEPRQHKRAQTFTDKDYEKLLAEIKFANGIIERKTFDWIGLLNRLEGVVPAGLTLTSVEPKSADRTLNLSGISLNLKNIRKLMENLEESDFFSEVYLHKHAESSSADEQRGITFNISCKFAS